MLGRLADLLGVAIDPNVFALLVVVIIGALCIMANWKIGVVVLAALLLLIRAQAAAALPRVIEAAKNLPDTIATLGQAVDAVMPLRNCDDLTAVLATIRQLESGGDYRAVSPDEYATGAYQFADATWVERGGTGRAMDAPPAEQDERARAYVAEILAEHGDVAAVPVQWFWPVALDDPAQLDFAPFPGLHNGMTVRQYQTKWMAALAEQPSCATTTSAYVLPIAPGTVASGEFDDPHHDYPAIDIALPEGTPIYAVTAGRVVTVRTTERNCRDCAPVEMCGIGVSIESDDGVRWSYCHARSLDVSMGEWVTAGQQVMESGNTGHSTGPHLHFGIKVAGEWRCPQPLLVAIDAGTEIPNPTTLPNSGCSY